MEEKVGEVVKYFAKIGVAAVKITKGSIKVGDSLHFQGANTDFVQKVESMQIEHQNVETASEGDLVGIKVKDRVRPSDHVYRVIE
ncbi:MAG: EF-Tu/IF-2/RF-3 family GTPase [Candidatus Aenigmatarchaeota archaeon]